MDKIKIHKCLVSQKVATTQHVPEGMFSTPYVYYDIKLEAEQIFVPLLYDPTQYPADWIDVKLKAVPHNGTTEYNAGSYQVLGTVVANNMPYTILNILEYDGVI